MAAGWNNSLKLLQFQVEAAKKRQQSTLNSLMSQKVMFFGILLIMYKIFCSIFCLFLKRDKHATSVAPVIDLTEKKKPQLQLKKESEFLSNRNNYSEVRFNALTGKVNNFNLHVQILVLNTIFYPI